MHRIVQILIFSLYFISCSNNAQDKKIYLLFENNKVSKCEISPYRDGRDKKEILIAQKKNFFKENKIIFKICKQFFVFNPGSNTKKSVSTMPKTIVDIEYLLNLWENNYLNSSKEMLFEKIYILEKSNNDSFIEYEVTWQDLHINDN